MLTTANSEYIFNNYYYVKEFVRFKPHCVLYQDGDHVATLLAYLAVIGGVGNVWNGEKSP
jgi:hypothetical protein